MDTIQVNTEGGVVVTGIYPDMYRISTGIWSLDRALSYREKDGMPLRSIYEIYGPSHVGKSTFTYFLSGCVPGTRISLCDLEGLDKDRVKLGVEASGFSGEVKIIALTDGVKPRQHSDMVQEMLLSIRKGEANAGILDSVGAYIPIAEATGDIGEANMGRSAHNIGQIARRAMSYLMSAEKPGAIFFVNHQHAVLSGHGHTTSGGVTLKYLGAIRIALWRAEVLATGDPKKGEERINWADILTGTVEKLRFGGAGRNFTVVHLKDHGVSRDLSCMFDCFRLGLAERDKTVKVNRASVGYISKLVRSAYEGDHKPFLPFWEVMAEWKTNQGIRYEEEVTDEPES